MALITTLPNFFTSVQPTAADFNNAAKAIGHEIGATYYDEALAQYVTAAGNLDNTNIASNALFQNYHKAEPYSTFVMNATIRSNGTIFNDSCFFGPMPFEIVALALGITCNSANLWYYIGGVIDCYLNGRYFTTFAPTTVAGAKTDSAFLQFQMPLRPGDWLAFDLSGTQSANGPVLVATATRSPGVAPTPVAPAATDKALISLYCKAVHVRS